MRKFKLPETASHDAEKGRKMKLHEPTLDRETAMKLWIEEHSDYAKEQVVLNNVGMVGIVLKSLNLNPLDEDLFATGLVGVVKAVNTFNPDKGVKFTAYATPIIRNEILMTFRKKRIIPVFSLDEPYDLGNGESVDLSEVIADSRRFGEEVIADIQLNQFFSRLNEREKKIITLSVQDKKQREIAKICGFSQPQVSRIIKSVYKKWGNDYEL